MDDLGSKTIDRNGDLIVATLLNKIELLGVVDGVNEGMFSELIGRLKDFKEELFSGSVNRYVDEIIEVVEYVVERYNKENIKVSDTSFLYN
jgi:hypothetical protein